MPWEWCDGARRLLTAGYQPADVLALADHIRRHGSEDGPAASGTPDGELEAEEVRRGTSPRHADPEGGSPPKLTCPFSSPSDAGIRAAVLGAWKGFETKGPSGPRPEPGHAATRSGVQHHVCVAQLRDDLLRRVLLPSPGRHRKSPPARGRRPACRLDRISKAGHSLANVA